MYKFLEKIKQAMPLGGFWISVLILSAITSFIYVQKNDKDDLSWAWQLYHEELELREEVGDDVYSICRDGTVFEDYKADQLGGGCWNSKHGGSYYDQYFSDEELARTPDQRLHSNNIILVILYSIGILILIELAPNIHRFFFLRN